MTEETEFRAFGLQQVLHIGLMRVMALCTFTVCNRDVRICAIKQPFFVTFIAKLIGRGLELGLVIALVDVVAVQAISSCYRAMYELHSVLALMAFVTETRFSVVCQNKCLLFESWVFLVGEFMTRGALTLQHRQVGETFLFHDAGMATAIIIDNGSRKLSEPEYDRE